MYLFTQGAVKVGFGASAFWIDRYEASIYLNPDGTGTQYGAGSQDYPSTRACRASGKRLPSHDEWLEAAAGTPDPGASNGNGGACNTTGNAKRLTGGGTACVSTWGAQDMIGNVHEFGAQWGASLGNTTPNASPWPSGSFAPDATVNRLPLRHPAVATLVLQGFHR